MDVPAVAIDTGVLPLAIGAADDEPFLSKEMTAVLKVAIPFFLALGCVILTPFVSSFVASAGLATFIVVVALIAAVVFIGIAVDSLFHGDSFDMLMNWSKQRQEEADRRAPGNDKAAQGEGADLNPGDAINEEDLEAAMEELRLLSRIDVNAESDAEVDSTEEQPK